LNPKDKRRSIVTNLNMTPKQQSEMLGYPLANKENEPPHFESITRHMTTKVN
jgi:hypothetical protein